MYPDEIEVPMLLVAGWFDHNINDDVLLFDTLRALSPVAGQHRLLIGPWTHGGLGRVPQGDLSFPEAENWDDIVGNQFFAHYLLGEDNGWEQTPFVQYFQMGENTWQEAAFFPPSGLDEIKLYLTENLGLATGLPSNSGVALDFTYNPNDPSPTIGGKTLAPLLEQGPLDQSQAVESRSDALVFTTEVLTEDLAVKGKIKALLFVSSDKKDTDFALRLTEVHPDGRSFLLNESIQRMRFRNGYTANDTAFMQQGEVYPITLEFDHLAHTFKTGNRLRLIVTSSNYPRYNRNMNTGGDMYPNGNLDTLAGPLVATNALHVQGSQLSRLEIPVAGSVNNSQEALDNEAVVLYPNPGSGRLFLENLPVGAVLWLCDAQGVFIKKFDLKHSENSLDLSHLQAGIYFLHLENGRGGRQVKKIVVAR
jgi:putative CocE/NonD family hydrolase